MNQSGFSKIGALVLLAISLTASYYVVDQVWKPDVDQNMRLAYIGGGGLAGMIVLGFLGSLIGGGKGNKHLGGARRALDHDDPVAASEILYPLLRRCVGDDTDFTNQVFDMMEEAYAQAEAEVDFASLREIHGQMVEIAREHRTGDGLIKDPTAGATFNQLNARADGVIQTFPRLG